MSFINENGEWIGFDLELAEAIATELGAELELVPVDGTTRISFLRERSGRHVGRFDEPHEIA